MPGEATYEAIALRRRDQGENDRRVTLLTRERGKLDAVAKGARKAASRLAAATEPLAQMRVTLAEARSRAARGGYMTAVEPRPSRPGLRADYTRLSAALSLAELYAAVLPYEQEEPDAFDLLAASLDAIELHPKPAVAALYCQMRLMELSGVAPSFGACVVTGEPLTEREPFLSPLAGGYVSYAVADDHPDRFRSRYEVLIALDRIVALDAPPANVKLVELCLAVLLPFWLVFVEMALPATDAFVHQIAAEGAPPGVRNVTE